MTKHTPGPWMCMPDSSNPYCVLIQSEGGTITRIFSTNPINDEDQTNAKLIAAAPDLRKLIADTVESQYFDYDTAEALLAKIDNPKAEGG